MSERIEYHWPNLTTRVEAQVTVGLPEIARCRCGSEARARYSLHGHPYVKCYKRRDDGTSCWETPVFPTLGEAVDAWNAAMAQKRPRVAELHPGDDGTGFCFNHAVEVGRVTKRHPFCVLGTATHSASVIGDSRLHTFGTFAECRAWLIDHLRAEGFEVVESKVAND